MSKKRTHALVSLETLAHWRRVVGHFSDAATEPYIPAKLESAYKFVLEIEKEMQKAIDGK